MFNSIGYGLVAGVVHVIAFPDHWIAISPTAFQKPRSALRNGFAWGVGHSAGIIALSGIAIFLKDLVNIERMTSFADLLVGVALLIFGFLAIKASLGLRIHTHKHNHGSSNLHQHFHLHLRGNKKHFRHSHAFTSLGILHGFAGGSHFIAAIPALALPTLEASVYIFSYLLGSLIAMLIVVMTMSLATLKAGQNVLPVVMRITGSLSVSYGLFWIHRTYLLIP